MKAYKLFRQLQNGRITPLFINKTQHLPINEWLQAEDHPTKGYAHRPGWHCTVEPKAPHLSDKNRVWYEVEVKDFSIHKRPSNQGGEWILAQQMKIIKPVSRVDNILWQIDPEEWYYKGCFIQQQDHPKLQKYHVFQDTEEQLTVGTCSTFKQAKELCEQNSVENPMHSPLEFI